MATQLTIPDRDTLRLLLTSGLIKPETASSPVTARFEGDRVIATLDADLGRSAAELRKVGVIVGKPGPSAGDEDESAFRCWPQLLPLVGYDPIPKDADSAGASAESALASAVSVSGGSSLSAPAGGRSGSAAKLTAKTPVLFELPAARLAEVAGEVLRLGNDRISFRLLKPASADGQARALLRVVGPPYYTLLRAIDSGLSAGEGADPKSKPKSKSKLKSDDRVRAYLEQAPRVWVEWGWTHPLAHRIQPAPGRWLIIRHPRDWDEHEESRFQDIYETSEFLIPAAPIPCRAGELPEPIKVPLKLIRGGAPDPPTLWVLRERGFAQLDELARTSPDYLLRRLLFAVADAGDDNDGGGEPILIVRARPSKESPPELSLDGVACRPYLRLDHLFLPCNTRLNPPLRRDAVAKLLAPEPNRIVWLNPGLNGSFIAEHVPDSAFQPMDRWVDYVLEHERRPIQTWMDAARFEFEEFICPDSRSSPEPKPDADKQRKPNRQPTELVDDNFAAASPKKYDRKPKPETPETPNSETESQPAVSRTSTEQIRRRLQRIHQEFLALDAPLDAEERLGYWPKMASLNAQLLEIDEAAICWANAVWPRWDAGSPQTQAQSRLWSEWLAAEFKDAKRIDDDIDKILSEKVPTVNQVRRIAVALGHRAFAAAPNSVKPTGVETRLAAILPFLEKHESALPVRIVWLAWSAAAKLAGDDVLAMARARDRLLERLHQQGLRWDVDMPVFLRFSQSSAREHHQAVRQQVSHLHKLARQWVWDKTNSSNPPCNQEFVDLMFAYALARMGEATRCADLLAQAKGTPVRDQVHHWLRSAFTHRIQQTLDSKLNDGVFPDEMHNALEAMPTLDRFKVDRLLQYSRILQPMEQLDAYRFIRERRDAISVKLLEAAETRDRRQLETKLNDLLRMKPEGTKPETQRAQVLEKTYELAHRLGEPFARQVLSLWPQMMDGLAKAKDLSGQGRLLDKAITLAAHYDMARQVEDLIQRFRDLLEQAAADSVDAIEPVLKNSFRGLRKTGSREKIAELLTFSASVVRKMLEAKGGKDKDKEKETRRGAPPASNPPRSQSNELMQSYQSLLLMLPIASGWFAFNQTEDAVTVFDEAQTVLSESRLLKADKRQEHTALTVSSLRALGETSAEFALPRLADVFRSVSWAPQSLSVGSHYSLNRLQIVEALTLSLISDNFALDESSRRWLDDDEYLIRKRIHADVRAALA